MKSNRWVVGWTILILSMLMILGVSVYIIDPYIHYHKPLTEKYFYSLDNQRGQNDGISRYFDYDAVIIGNSMVENFKTSEFDELFGVNSIKIPFQGATYKEINDNLSRTLKRNPNIKMVIRCLDYEMIPGDKDRMREDMGEYPDYLYDENPINDIKYLFNKDILFNRVYKMLYNSKTEGFEPGITSFDEYSNWGDYSVYGPNIVIPQELVNDKPDVEIHLTDEEKELATVNVIQNITSLASEYPDVDFYYYFSPYSALYWNKLTNEGAMYRHLEAEKCVIELILEQPNIHLYSFNDQVYMITDLNNYKDYIHYGPWVNSFVLKCLKDGKGLLTKDNYQNYLESEYAFYSNFDYTALNDQVDYEDDFYAAQQLNGN